MKEQKILQNLGLSEAEAKIYLTVLETGSTLAGPIIKKTGLHRGTTYQILQRLQEKGLISSVIKGKKQHFEAASPKAFLQKIKQQEQELQNILPTLLAKQPKTKQKVTVYSGKKGIRTVMDNILEELNPHGKYFDFGVSGLFRKVMGPYWDIWQQKKKKYKILSKVIFNEELKDKQLLKDYYGQARFHQKKYNSLTDTIIYNDTIILFIWTAKPPIAVVIKNKDNAEGYKNQFRLLWKQAKE